METNNLAVQDTQILKDEHKRQNKRSQKTSVRKS